MTEPVPITAARAEEFAAALTLAFQHLPVDERQPRVASALRHFNSREVDPAGILVLRDRHQVQGCVVCQLLPGRTGVIWPPQVSRGVERGASEDCLTKAGIAWLLELGAAPLQAMLAPNEAWLAAPLLRNGFVHTTALIYLRQFLDLSAALFQQPAILQIEPYSTCDQDDFHHTLLSSYAGTLDCPELNGQRDVVDIIAGHRAHGNHDPDLWWLAWYDGAPVAVLIATVIPEVVGFEIAYVGVVPEARRRGFGRELVLRAMLNMREREGSQVILTVDARNEPALRLYREVGFEPFDRREVFLCL